jgi:hypothetical protein
MSSPGNNLVFIKPASDVSALERVVKAACEGLVRVAVAEEARIETNRFVQNRREVSDKSLWKSAAAKEADRKNSKLCKGLMVDIALGKMITKFKSDCAMQIHIAERGFVEYCGVHPAFIEGRADDYDTVEPHSLKVCPRESYPTQISPAEICSKQVSFAEIDADQPSPGEFCAKHIRTTKIHAN